MLHVGGSEALWWVVENAHFFVFNTKNDSGIEYVTT